MKFVTYRDTAREKKIKNDHSPRVGLRFSDSKSNTQEADSLSGIIVDFRRALELVSQKSVNEQSSFSEKYTKDILSVISGYHEILPYCLEIQKFFIEGKIPHSIMIPESTCELLSPLPVPSSLRDAYAFKQHVETSRKNRGLEMIPEFFEFPVFYFSNRFAVQGPGVISLQSNHFKNLDFELEVAFVISKEGKNIPPNKAHEYLFGLMIMNDWSERSIQRREVKLNLGPHKAKDFATSLGPYLVTLDELKDSMKLSDKGPLFDLPMEGFLNGKKISAGNLKDMHWTFGEILARVSDGVTVYPGEVIGSGTVGTGCLFEINSGKPECEQAWLQPNDEISLHVKNLGLLKNKVVLSS